MENHFRCLNCKKEVLPNEYMGTEHRNHCPFCLWSRHVDEKTSGDRKSSCYAGMKPVGLTFKQEGLDKYGKARQGELMVIHKCTNCGRISINRIAGDDNPEVILEILEGSKGDEDLKKELEEQNIKILGSKDQEEVKKQLFGRTS